MEKHKTISGYVINDDIAESLTPKDISRLRACIYLVRYRSSLRIVSKRYRLGDASGFQKWIRKKLEYICPTLYFEVINQLKENKH